jgi:endonuclease YncB( thermonuclease family)
MKISPVLLAAVALGFALHARSAEPIVGRATVIDGDTLEISGERVRLRGVDAPESWQICEDGDGGSYRCGREAAFELDKFLAASRPIRCEVVERDRYLRSVGICYRADGSEVNRWLVESGHAVDWEKYSRSDYADAQQLARSRSAGVWRGKFQLPCQVRAKRAKRGPSC